MENNWTFTECGSREEWLHTCKGIYAQFLGACQMGLVAWHQVAYVRDKGRAVGAVIITRSGNGDWYAGASYCSRRDRANFTKDEALARALVGLRQVTAEQVQDAGLRQLFVTSFPRSCRETVMGLLDSLPAFQPRQHEHLQSA